MNSLLIEGLLALRRSEGPGWPDYQDALDLAYGVSQETLTESYSDDGQNHWNVNGVPQSTALYNGMRYTVALDLPQVCSTGGTNIYQFGNNNYFFGTLASPEEGMWMPWYVEQLENGSLTADQLRKHQVQMQRTFSLQGGVGGTVDAGGYQLGSIIAAMNNPGPTLQDVPFSITNLGSGNYQLSWTVPSNAQSYKIKWGEKAIAPSSGLLNFDPVFTNSFGISPDTNETWFSAHNVNDPAPLSPGSPQSFTVATGLTGLAAANFSVKAYVTGGSSSSTAPQISSFSASPSSITYGSSTTLSWSVAGATSLSIDNGIGSQSNLTNGSVSVSPTQTTAYTLTASNVNGNSTAQTTATVNLLPDTAPPTASITAPANNATVSGTATVSATASDPAITGQVTSGLKTISLLVDGTAFATSTASPATASLDTTALTNGTHVLTATAIDNAGNSFTTSPLTVTVNNASAPKYPRLAALTSLEGLPAIPANQPITATILSAANGSTLETQPNLLPNAGKQYTVTFQPADPQLVNIRIKAANYLSQLLANVDTTVNSAAALPVPQLPSGDLNNDNAVNVLDYSLMNQNWLKSGAGDLNGDGIVNSIDFAILKNNYGKAGQ